MECLLIEKKLYDASVRGDVQSLNGLLRQDEFAIHNYTSSNNETLLHVAAARGHVEFAKVVLQHKHDLVNELDSRLRSPLHLACANARVEMMKLLLNQSSEVCSMEDEFGRTPLHLAAINGQVEIVNELVRARPEAVICPLNRTRTIAILHSYVIRKGPDALDPLVEVDYSFLNSKDAEGNTILHKVVALKKIEILKYLISKKELDVHMKNHDSITALDLIDQMPKDSETAYIRELLTKYKSPKNKKLPPNYHTKQSSSHHENMNEDTDNYTWLDSKRNGILVGATVIASMAYQAGLNPPGGVWEDNKESYINAQNETISVVAGTSIMADNYPTLHIIFWASNTASFVAALSIVLLLIRGSPRLSHTSKCRVFMTKLYMWFLTGVIWVTTTAIALTYACAMIVIAPKDPYREEIQIRGNSTIHLHHHQEIQIRDNSTISISAVGVIALVVLASIVIIINGIRLLIYVCVKFVKCIMRCFRKKSDQHGRQIQGNNTGSLCCLCV